MLWNSASAQEWDFTALMVWWCLVPSPRREFWCAKPSPNKPPGSPIWSTKYYKSVEFVELWNVKHPCTDVKPPYWRLSDDDSGGTAHFRNLEENWFQNLRFVGSNPFFSLMLLFRHAKTTVGHKRLPGDSSIATPSFSLAISLVTMVRFYYHPWVHIHNFIYWSYPLLHFNQT